MKIKNFLTKHYSKLILFFIFVLAVALRWLYLPGGAIVFGYDQGRDAFIVQDILKGDLKVQGPPVGGLPGVFHGVLYYYVVAPAYLLGQGNPVAAALWMSFLNALGVFVVYYITMTVFGKKQPALISALVYAFSFEASQYASWLSNVPLAMIFVPLMYFGIYLWFTKGNKFGPWLTGFALGLSIQCNAALAYHILPVIFWIYIFRKKATFKTFGIFFGTFLLATSTMILSEIKFNGGGIAGLWYLFSSQDKIANAIKLGEFVVNYLNQIGNVYSFTLFPLSVAFGGLVGIVVSLITLKSWAGNKFKNYDWEALTLSAPIAYAFALSFGGGSTPHITVGIASLLSIMIGILLWKLFTKNKFIAVGLLLIILLSNVIKIVTENKNGQTNFAIQKGLILSSELKSIDDTYTKSNGEPFSISTLTSPLFVNTTWSYLYNWYGMKKYGYLPYWIGHDQIGQVGNNLKNSPKGISKHFFIIEPTYSIPELYITYANGDQDAISTLVKEDNFGILRVQERRMKK